MTTRNKILLKTIIKNKLFPNPEYDLHDDIYIFECLNQAIHNICQQTWLSRDRIIKMITNCLNEYIEKV